MADKELPKAILFDIGGVCVLSPFQAILDYEKSLSIPPGYINFCISRLAPNGYWHRPERGEIPMDSTFFNGFKSDLSRPEMWQAFHERLRSAPSTSSSTSEDDKLEKAWVSSKPVPDIDAEYLFWQMMSHSRTPDPYIFPALKKLKESKKFIIAALSNTVIFPDGHPYNNVEDGDVIGLFDVFVSSAHVGLRKPDPKIYQHALQKLKELAEKKRDQLEAKDVVFLDDIGENSKAGRAEGMRTIRVVLGRTYEAVKQLEEVTGMELLDGKGKEMVNSGQRSKL